MPGGMSPLGSNGGNTLNTTISLCCLQRKCAGRGRAGRRRGAACPRTCGRIFFSDVAERTRQLSRTCRRKQLDDDCHGVRLQNGCKTANRAAKEELPAGAPSLGRAAPQPRFEFKIGWRRCMGVEPTLDQEAGRATVLKTV